MNNSSYDLSLHKIIGRGGVAAPSGWQRPSEWPALTVPGTNEITGLFAVDKSTTDVDGVPVAITVTCPSGTYTVDWGDGTVNSTISSGTKLSHLYIPSNTTGVTDTTYGYKVAVVKITATTNITIANFNVTYGSNIATNRGTNWLSLDINCPALVGNLNAIGNSTVGSALACIQEYRLRSSALTGTDLTNFFYNLRTLQKVHEITTTGTPTTVAGMFFACSSLEEIPLFTTSSVTTFLNFLNSCQNLEEIPLFDTSAATIFTSTFTGCTSLKTIPLLDTTNVTNWSGTFSACYSLEKLPDLVFTAATVMTNIFSECHSLKYLPSTWDTSSVATNSWAGMFNSCWNLQAIPACTGAAMTSNSNLIGQCYSLKSFGISLVGALNWNIGINYMLGKDALVQIFNALPTSANTITITNCRGASALSAGDRLIATTKGWTIVG